MNTSSVGLQIFFVFYFCISLSDAQITAVNDVVSITTDSSYNRPFCINILANDLITTNTTIISTISGAGKVFVNASPVFVATVCFRQLIAYVTKSGVITIEAESYHILNERDGPSYEPVTNNSVWTEFQGGNALNGISMQNINGTYSTSAYTYGPALGYNIIFQNASSYFVFVRGARCSGAGSSGVHAYTRLSNNNINFFTNNTPISSFQAGGGWVVSTSPLQVIADQTYPRTKPFYLAMFTKGICLDRISIQTDTTPPKDVHESLLVKCTNEELLYYPPAGFNGVDLISYKIADGNMSSVATVTVYVNIPVPSPSPTASPSVTPSTSVTPSSTPSPSGTPSPSATPSSTPSNSVTPSLSPPPSASSSLGSSPSVTPSVTPSVSTTPSNTPNPSTTASMTPVISPSTSASPSCSPSVSPSASPFPPICFGNSLNGELFALSPNQSNSNFVSGKLFSVSFSRLLTDVSNFSATFYLFSNLQTDAGMGFGASIQIPFTISSSLVQQFNFTAIQITSFVQYTAMIDNVNGEDVVTMQLASSSVDGQYLIKNNILENNKKAVFQYCMIPDSWPSPSPTPLPSASSSSIASVTAIPSSSLLVPSPQDEGGHTKKSNSGAVIGGVVGGAVGLSLCALVALFALKRKRHQAKNLPSQDLEMKPEPSHYSVPLSESQSNYAPIKTETLMDTSTERASLSQNWSIQYSDIKLENQIGKGAFGIVYKGTWQGIQVAVKQTLTEKDVTVQEFFAEADLMMKMRPHPNITQLLGVCASPLCLVTEFVHNGSLSDWLEKHTLSREQMLSIARGIATGMLYLHNEGVVHRDLAARNILLDKTLTPKVSDFGMSRVALDNKTNKTASEIGPIRWMAPEAMRQRVYNKKTDVWSYGTVLYEILTRQIPYSKYDLMQVAASVMMGELSLIPEIEEHESSYPKILVKVLKACLKFNPEERPLFAQIIEMYDDNL